MRTVIVARDPGAASALAPVARRWPSAVIGLDAARPVFERAGIPLVGPSADREPGVAEEWLRRLQPRVLVTGTSRLDLVPLDAQWWDAARSIGVPSVAVLDHWIGYWQKFTRHNRFDTVPDAIAVMDSYARDRLVELGCRGPRLVVTGQPALDTLTKEELPGCRAARDHWGLSDDAWVVLFVSEPIAADHGARLGYDETDALSLLLEALDGLPAELVVKPHPREQPDRLAEVLRRFGRPARVETRLDGRSAAAGADSVAGMTSVLLLEAALAGRPVLSIQPGVREPWTEHFGSLVVTVESAAGARAWLHEPESRAVLGVAERRSRLEAAGFDGRAAERVCQLLEELSHE